MAKQRYVLKELCIILMLLCVYHIEYYVYCLKNGRNEMNQLFTETFTSFLNNASNPWENFMKKFDIPTNHGSGVRIDLGRLIINEQRKAISYSTGRCPVFSKHILFNKNFFETLKIMNVYVNKFFKNKPHESTIYTIKDNKQHRLVRPIIKPSIYECAKHVNKFNMDNCGLEDKEKCLRDSFFYHLETKLCFVIFPIIQLKKNVQNKFPYAPADFSKASFVYGSTNIRHDWETFCPMKPIKGASFGKWIKENRTCERMEHINIGSLNFGEENTANLCGLKLISLSPSDGYEIKTISNGKGNNWANWDPERYCHIYNVTPNCLIYEKNGYAFTSTAIVDHKIYDLPPCIKASIGWKIMAKCGTDIFEKEYTCNGEKWTTYDNVQLNSCGRTNEEIFYPIENPWSDYMNMFNFTYLNSGGEEMTFGTINKYKFPLDKCPLFGKMEQLSTNISSKNILCALHLKRDSIYECALHFKSIAIIKCRGKYEKCKFGYNLKTKNCCMLFYDLEKKNLMNSEMVYGFYNIHHDWHKRCPIKPVVGVEFGHWNKNYCEELPGNQLTSNDFINNKTKCAELLVESASGSSSIIVGYHLASHNPIKGCKIHNEVPNCLINAKRSIAFASTGINNLNVYDLPPCIEASQGWEIEAKCNNDSLETTYICRDGKWISKNGNTIYYCKSVKYPWTNIEDGEVVN